MSQADLFEQVVRRLNPHNRLVRHWSLTGGISAQVTALEIAREDGSREILIVRQHGTADCQRNPHIAADEFKLLETLHKLGLPVPRPYSLDTSGQIFPMPYLIVEYLEGSPKFAPEDTDSFVRQCAEALAAIHQITAMKSDLSFLPGASALYAARLSARPALLDTSLDEDRIRPLLEAAWPFAPANLPALLHGDFWPGNLVWKSGDLVGVIDWEDAALGDPLADLGNARLEILWVLGIQAMEDFTTVYQTIMSQINFSTLPYWDLLAALRPASKLSMWAGDPAREQAMRSAHHDFVRQAFEQLSIRY